MKSLSKVVLALLSLAALLIPTGQLKGAAPEVAQFDKSKSALILIEYQRDWLDEDGKLHSLLQDEQLLRTSLDSSKVALSAARKAGMTIVHVGLSFAQGYPELGRDAKYGLRKAIPAVGSFQKAVLQSG